MGIPSTGKVRWGGSSALYHVSVDVLATTCSPETSFQGLSPHFHLQEMPSVSVLDYALPQRPPQAREEERDPSERALPRRSSSPIIGSPPVRAVPIGTPPKQAAMPNFNQQVWPPQLPTAGAGPLVRSQRSDHHCFLSLRSCVRSLSTSGLPCSSATLLPTARGCPPTSSATCRYPLLPPPSPPGAPAASSHVGGP